VIVLVGCELLHRDIKLDNVLVRRGDAGVLRETLLLTDFGTLRSFADQANGCTRPGRVSLSADIHLNALNNSYDRMYL
jgi:serine/threonine protein kinase